MRPLPVDRRFFRPERLKGGGVLGPLLRAAPVRNTFRVMGEHVALFYVSYGATYHPVLRIFFDLWPDPAASMPVFPPHAVHCLKHAPRQVQVGTAAHRRGRPGPGDFFLGNLFVMGVLQFIPPLGPVRAFLAGSPHLRGLVIGQAPPPRLCLFKVKEILDLKTTKFLAGSGLVRHQHEEARHERQS